MRILPLMGGLAGAVALSQFPEFSQQYLQRLGGRADALAAVVQDFDASAAKAGMTRAAALDDLSSSAFQQFHQADLRATIARAEAAQSDLALLRAASPLERIALPHRFRDTETLAATWADFRPAMPATSEGMISAGIGFAGGWAALAALAALLTAPFRSARRPRGA